MPGYLTRGYEVVDTVHLLVKRMQMSPQVLSISLSGFTERWSGQQLETLGNCMIKTCALLRTSAKYREIKRSCGE